MFRALGLVEVLGSADAIQVVDVMVKTSDVEFQTWHTRCGGHTTVFVSGDVAAVTEAVERVKTNPPCEVVKTAVISNPSEEAERLVLEFRENSRFARAAFEK
ncbi:MAG: BMC domain-containing protein [Lachnospiraceae bacterium]